MKRRGFLALLPSLPILLVGQASVRMIAAADCQWSETLGDRYRLEVRLPDGRRNAFVVWPASPEPLTAGEILRARELARAELVAWIRRQQAALVPARA